MSAWERSDKYLRKAQRFVDTANEAANSDLETYGTALVECYASLAQANVAVAIALRSAGY